MDALRRLFASAHTTPALAGELEIAVHDVLREAEELSWLLRKHREKRQSGSHANGDAPKGSCDA
jgi:hypothetical protein